MPASIVSAWAECGSIAAEKNASLVACHGAEPTVTVDLPRRIPPVKNQLSLWRAFLADEMRPYFGMENDPMPNDPTFLPLDRVTEQLRSGELTPQQLANRRAAPTHSALWLVAGVRVTWRRALTYCLTG